MMRIKIRTKFIILGSLGILTLLVIVLLAINISRLGRNNLNDVYKDSKQVQSIQEEFIAPIFYLRELSSSLVFAPNDDFRKEINIRLEPLVKSLSQKFKILPENIKNEWIKYQELLNITRRFIKEGFEEGAVINVNQEEREQFYVLVGKLRAMQMQKLQKSSNTFVNAKNAISSNITTLLFISTILIFSIILLGWFIIAKISNAIEQVKAGHTRFFYFLKHKNQDEDLGITLDTNDELGDMARAINKEMREIKKALRRDIKFIEVATRLVEELKEGSLDKRLHVNAHSIELNTLKTVINNMLDELEGKIQQEIQQRTDQEKLLIQQSKLATMGKMIGNIAHQWRQPLTELNAILMNIDTRYKYNDFDEKFIETSVQECNEITSYMSNTINDFQNFFKPSKTKELFYVVKACKQASAILQSSLKNHNISYICSYTEDKEVFGYPNEFSQAFLNIISNAKDVLIQRKVVNPFIKVHISIGKKYVLIKIEDNGGGIKEEHLDRIFEPYFTTKHAKQGTGIGLYMSKTIIEGNMDGVLNVENREQGACFTIKLK